MHSQHLRKIVVIVVFGSAQALQSCWRVICNCALQSKPASMVDGAIGTSPGDSVKWVLGQNKVSDLMFVSVKDALNSKERLTK